jgi:hypothetical protein
MAACDLLNAPGASIARLREWGERTGSTLRAEASVPRTSPRMRPSLPIRRSHSDATTRSNISASHRQAAVDDFRTKSEKVTRKIEQLELKLEELETGNAQRVSPATKTDTPPRNKPTRRPLPEHLPVNCTHISHSKGMSRLWQRAPQTGRRCL